MKRIKYLLLLLALCITTAAFSQQKQKTVTLSLRHVTVKTALKALQKESGLSYWINAKDVDLQKVVSVEVKSATVEDALKVILKGQNVHYSIKDGHIVISKSAPSAVLNRGEWQGTHKVTGTVTDEKGQSLPGVSVVIKGTTRGTITDLKGNYTLSNVPSSKDLVFSFVGYERQDVPVKNQEVLNVQMQPANIGLNEVVVMGYGSRKKSTLTGAVSVVDVKDIKREKIPNVAQALQGQVAGVVVTSSTGAPGDPIQVRIRGNATIGNNNPLYIVDGVPTRDITFLNPSDIKSMTVLKDAAAAAIYGSRASNGVILITTDQGKAGQTRFSVHFYQGWSTVSNLPVMCNAQQYMSAVTTAWNNSDRTGANPYTTGVGQNGFKLANTNWLKELFTVGHSSNVQFSASGGNAKARFLVSLNYYHNNGIVIFNNDQYQRFDYRTNFNANLTKRLKIGTNLLLSGSTQDALSSKGDQPGIIRHALIRPPVLAVYKSPSDPTYSKSDPFTDMPFYTKTGYDVALERSLYEMSQNPIALAYFTDNKKHDYRTFGNVFGEYSFLKNKNLKFRTNLGVDLSFTHDKAFAQNFGDDDGGGSAIDAGLGRENRPSSLNENRGQAFTYTWNNVINYVKNINQKNYLHALIGSEYINNYESSIGASRERYAYTSPQFRFLDYGNSTLDVWNSGTASQYALMSYFGSVTYVYDNKIMATGIMRADASSRFAKKHRWGYFPSISVGYKISSEKFMKNLKWLSNLKIRGSWGRVGNQEIPNYAYLTLISQSGGKVVINRFGNPDLKWETTTQSNIGFDLGMFENKLSISAEYYWKRTTGILLPVSLPSVVGNVQPTIVNAGIVSNKGFECTVNYRNYNHKFKYSFSGNIATLKNNVDQLYPNLPVIMGAEGVTRTVVGQPIASYYGYKAIGIYQTDAEINSYLHGTVDPTATVKPGDIKFADLNGDGVINSKDETFIGKSVPDFTYGFTFNGSYKGFDVSMLWQGVQGISRYNSGKQIVDYDTRPFNYTVARVKGAWHGPGTSNTIPRLTFEDNGGSKVSSIFVENASYLRLVNFEIGYTVKMKNQIKSLHFYVSGQNLLTFTKYSGLDPQTTDVMDMGTYPSARSFLLGVNVNL